MIKVFALIVRYPVSDLFYRPFDIYGIGNSHILCQVGIGGIIYQAVKGIGNKVGRREKPFRHKLHQVDFPDCLEKNRDFFLVVEWVIMNNQK